MTQQGRGSVRTGVLNGTRYSTLVSTGTGEDLFRKVTVVAPEGLESLFLRVLRRWVVVSVGLGGGPLLRPTHRCFGPTLGLSLLTTSPGGRSRPRVDTR